MIDTKTAKIFVYGSKVLRKKSDPVKVFDDNIKAIVDELRVSMYVAGGIGIAAPQVGINKRIIVVDVDAESENNTEVFFDGKIVPLALLEPLSLINPSFEPVSMGRESNNEGCLSIPNIRANVMRFTNISVYYQDVDGDKHCIVCKGLLSMCMQHEIDHLNGVLFTDYLSRSEKKTLASKFYDIKNFGEYVVYESEED